MKHMLGLLGAYLISVGLFKLVMYLAKEQREE